VSSPAERELDRMLQQFGWTGECWEQQGGSSRMAGGRGGGQPAYLVLAQHLKAAHKARCENRL